MSTAPHTEVNLEDEIVRELCKHGWLEGDWHDYDRDLALYPEDVLAWIQDTQPEQYAKIKSTQNGLTDKTLLDRLAKTIEEMGTLWVLRYGFKRTPAKFSMCQFAPDTGLNEKTKGLYDKVRCRVVRQVHYSTESKNSIDLVFFVNGIPISTMELKTEFTQTVGTAVEQYKNNRKPVNPKTGHRERLLTEKFGAVVHFAVSDEEVYMTTKLEGEKTVFLPFNLGYDEGAGNPPNPNGAKTAYLWERIFERASFLEILQKFAYIEKKTKVNKKGRITKTERLIFPRYHQLDVVRKLTADAKDKGAGKRYLIQHSAGSGKSNSITWLVHQLSNLHDATDKKIFDTVIVVTDRKVLDEQLRDSILQFDHKTGTIAVIDDEHGAKTDQLKGALEKNTPIISVTIQTFPFIVRSVGEQPQWAKRTFAVVIDEAHSSQSGKSAQGVRETLGDAGIEGEDEPDAAETILSDRMAKRADSKNISYFAFTATPKARTIELFGTPGPNGKPEAFHSYTMRQAIEEGFILDVLQSYTTYKVARKIATKDTKKAEDVVPKSQAARLIVQSARLHAYEVYQKVAIIVEHYRETVMPLLGGKAKAMIVTDSRPLAVQYKLETDRYIQEQNYDLKTLVAFSGTVIDDKRWPGKEFTENNMNNLRGVQHSRRLRLRRVSDPHRRR